MVSENNGGWGAAFQVPGLGALGRGARVMSVSCGPAGTCAAGGYFTHRPPPEAGVVVRQTG